jgi:hypothetical protein
VDRKRRKRKHPLAQRFASWWGERARRERPHYRWIGSSSSSSRGRRRAPSEDGTTTAGVRMRKRMRMFWYTFSTPIASAVALSSSLGRRPLGRAVGVTFFRIDDGQIPSIMNESWIFPFLIGGVHQALSTLGQGRITSPSCHPAHHADRILRWCCRAKTKAVHWCSCGGIGVVLAGGRPLRVIIQQLFHQFSS